MKRDTRSNRVLPNRICVIWFDPAFTGARTTTYTVILALSMFMMVAHVHYAYSMSGEPCLGCGFRTAVRLLLQGDIAGSVISNQLILPAVVFTCFALIDTLAIFRDRRSKVQRTTSVELQK